MTIQTCFSSSPLQTCEYRSYSAMTVMLEHLTGLMRVFADALHLSIPAPGLANGEAALQHAAYPGMQPYPGVGTYLSFKRYYNKCITVI